MKKIKNKPIKKVIKIKMMASRNKKVVIKIKMFRSHK